MLRKVHAMKIEKLWCAVASLCLAVQMTQAANKTWTGAVSSDWSNGGNWSPVGVPGLEDAVFINSGSVLATDAVTVASVSLSGGACTFNAPASLGALALSGNATFGGHQRGNDHEPDVDGRVYDWGGADGSGAWGQSVD